jgi:hypothetical protein
LEPSASALEPSPNSYSVLPVMSRIIRCANIGAGTVSRVHAGTTRAPEGLHRGRGTLRRPPHTPSCALRQGRTACGAVLPTCGLACRPLRILVRASAFCCGDRTHARTHVGSVAVHARLRDVAELVVRV